MNNLETIYTIYQEYIDGNEGINPTDWLCQYDLNQEEIEYFFSLLN
jgi:hypothetical protein